MRYARIENNEVKEIGEFQSIEGRFHPSLVWVPCETSVQQGWSYDGAAFSAPLPHIPTPAETRASLCAKIAALDQKRIRPLAEGDTVYLAKLNEQIAALRAQLK